MTIGGVAWWKIGCLGFIVVVGLAFLAFNELVGTGSGDRIIDGIPCGGAGGYHVHAHLTLLDRGHRVYLYDGIGRSQYGCYYWLHTHDSTGVIHVEARNSDFRPTLGNFFDIWGQPLSRRQFLEYRVGRGQAMRVYVNQHLYAGNPRDIVLRRHTTITLEIGPPFQRPRRYDFGTL